MTTASAKTDAEMLAEIKAYLDTSKKLASKSSSSSGSSNGQYVSSKLASPYNAGQEFVQEKKIRSGMLKKQQKQKKSKSSKRTDEDLLNYYTQQYNDDKNACKLSSQSYTYEEIQIKSINMPYIDTMMQIQEKMKIVDSLEYSDKQYRLLQHQQNMPPSIPSSQALSSTAYSKYDDIDRSTAPPLPHEEVNTSRSNMTGSSLASVSTAPLSTILSTIRPNISALHLKNRYPRLCKALHFDDTNLLSIKPRSDMWIVRFMEECYDEAILSCNQDVSEDRMRKRCGLFLGALDSFPEMCQRLLSRTFSVLEVREKVMLEILVTIEIGVLSYEFNDLRDDYKTFMINGCRSYLFACFLSEEYDLAYLAMFLHYRDGLQRHLLVQLKDLNQMRIWTLAHVATNNYYIDNSATATGTTAVDARGNDVVEKVKTIPVRLPSNLLFIPDATMHEAPLVAVDPTHLASICMHLGSGTSSGEAKIRHYLIHKVKQHMQSIYSNAMKRQQKHDKCSDTDVTATLYIPIYSILYVIVEQWKKIPIEDKFHMGAVGNSVESLKKLNGIYDKNCLQMKTLQKHIGTCNFELQDLQALLLKLDKQHRRVERKWKDNIALPREVEELPMIRVKITETKVNISACQSKLAVLLTKKDLLMQHVNGLWTEAAAASLIVKEDVQRDTFVPITSTERYMELNTPAWRRDVEELLVSAVTILYTNEQAMAMKSNLNASSSKANTATDDSHTTTTTTAAPTAAVAQGPEVDDIAEVMASIRSQAYDLSMVGAAEADSLGIEPHQQRIIRERKEKEMAQELDLEAVYSTEFYLEEKLSIKCNAYWTVEYKAKAALIAAEMERNAQHIADVMIDHMVDDAVIEDIVEARCIDGMHRAYVDVILDGTISDLVSSTCTDTYTTTCIVTELVDAVIGHLITDIVSVEEMVCAVVATVTASIVDDVTDGTIGAEIAQLNELDHRIDVLAFEAVVAAAADISASMLMDDSRDIIATAIDVYVDHIVTYASTDVYDDTIVSAIHVYIDDTTTSMSEDTIDVMIEVFVSQLIDVAVVASIDEYTDVVADIATAQAIDESVAELTHVYIDALNSERRMAEDVEILRSNECIAMYNIISTDIINALCIGISIDETRDPWECLSYELEPGSLQYAAVVEKRSVAHVMRGVLMKQTVIKVLKRGVRMSYYKRQDDRRLVHRLFYTWTHAHLLAIKKRCGAVVLQRFYRNIRARQQHRKDTMQITESIRIGREFDARYCYEVKAKAMLLFWYYRMRTRKKAMVTMKAIKERRFMICYYTWKMVYRRVSDRRLQVEAIQRNAVIVIQSSIRCRHACKRVHMARSGVRIVRCMKVCIAHKYTRETIANRRKLYEYEVKVSNTVTHNKVRKAYRRWLKSYRLIRGFNTIDRCMRMYQMRRNFDKMKLDTAYIFRYRTKCTIKMQSMLRMWFVKRYVLNYYRFRRGLICLQSACRRNRVRPTFVHAIYYYRMAKKVQKLFRGYRVRSHLTERRIIDLHLAASNNNYERLKYYCDKYPEIVSELDSDGNTSLHNAAKNAARRTLKLLLRTGHPSNALNLAGYTALHMIIASTAINRDDCCLYMLEKGLFDEELLTPDGKSCLSLAVANGRGVIVKRLLELGLQPNHADHYGTTPLQAACQGGYVQIVRDLIYYGADVNMPGYCGTYPFHDCIASGNVDVANYLFNHGAYINVVEPYQLQTPLMWAASAGSFDMVQLFLVQGAHVNSKDSTGWTCAHHAAVSNNMTLYAQLRDADANFDEVDLEGNTPLHIAVEYDAYEYALALLEGCCNVSLQNIHGNQPSHIAARDNRVRILELLIRYDVHIGRENYLHQTPLGVAKYYCCTEAQLLLEGRYGKVDIPGAKNDAGEIAWDQQIDNDTHGWRAITGARGQREFINDVTGERRSLPPVMSSAYVDTLSKNNILPMEKYATIVKQVDTVTKHEYLEMYKANKADVAAMVRLPNYQVTISRYWRRKLAYLELKRLKKRHACGKRIIRFIKKRVSKFMVWRRADYRRKATKLQACWRSYYLRKMFYYPGSTYDVLLDRRNRLRLRQSLWCVWKRFKVLRAIRIIEIAAHPPRTMYDWEPLLVAAHWPRRTVGVYEEYQYPQSKSIYFYRHKVTGDCTFVKPKLMQASDDRDWIEAKQRQAKGYTKREEQLVILLQSLWRGYQIRTYYTIIEKAMDISAVAEDKYMKAPDTDSNLYNYALHCHCVNHDYKRSRFLYAEAVRRMVYRGPDVAFVLYSYCIYAFVTRELDYSDVMMLLQRGKTAEEIREREMRKKRGEPESQALNSGTYRHGKLFDFANVGFFLHMAKHHDNTQSWHNYAACRFLIYNDFPGAFDSFLHAFRDSPGDTQLKENFDIMMRHFHGNDPDVHDRIIKERMRAVALKETEIQNVQTLRRDAAIRRKKMGMKIKLWLIQCRKNRSMRNFLKVVKLATAAAKRKRRAQRY